MKKIFIFFISIFLYADVSNILIQMNKIETYKHSFKKIYLTKCEKEEIKSVLVKNTVPFELVLKAIFNNKALINNTWVKKGDFIKGYKVLKIYSRKVILKKNNKIIVLKFNNNMLKVKK